MPDRDRVRVISLIPPEEEFPDSSLSWMTARVFETVGTADSACYLDARGLHHDALRETLASLDPAGDPVLVLGTTFALTEVLDRMDADGARFTLPRGSRIMDTGGFKGRAREMSRRDLLLGYARGLGVPSDHVVGEYGMTELSSQFYETVLDSTDPAKRVYRGPDWIRTRVLHPDTLEHRHDGGLGLLAHFDLANAWTVSAVVTEDLGYAVDGGFRFAGRASEAEIRGCSLTAAEILGGRA